MPVVAEEQLVRKYVAGWLSIAYFFNLACSIALVILPFVFAYSSDSMWLKEKVVRERPEVHFQHQALIIAEGATPADTYMYSTSPRLNEMFGSRLRAASLRVREDDADFDGRPEALHVHLTLPLNVDEEVRGITMFVALEYNLQDHARFSHNATAIVRHAAGAPGTSLQLISDLELRTASAIPQFATDLPIPQGPPVLVGAALEDHLSALSPAALISRYMSYPDVVRLHPGFPVWVPGGGLSTFTANVTMLTRPELVRVQPGVLEILKFGWVQYVSFVVPLFFVLRFIKRFAAYHQITPCRVVVDRPQKRLTDHDF